eukprot:TRINITY_DN363_c0_g1_i1.p1 TRINITY_DN363_c0_g1~~TRINITY_DN363_c0_g1_i1.p1  ORF type:complete len:480 (+),score=70.71 TRINITY_DN363_c0_g1_i1:53-1492(+)
MITLLLLILFIVVGLSVLLLFAPYWKARYDLEALRKKGYKTPHLIPPGNPFVGQSSVFRDHTPGFITGLHKKHGKNVGFFLQNKIHYSIDMKDYSKEVYVLEADGTLLHPTFKEVPVFPLSECNHFVRVLRTLHPANLKVDIPDVYDQFSKFFADKYPRTSTDKEYVIDIFRFCYEATAVYNLWTLAGLDYSEQGNLVDKFAHLYQYSSEDIVNYLSFPLLTPLWKMRAAKYGPEFEKILIPIIKKRRQEQDLKKYQDSHDFLGELLKYKDENGEPMTDQQILNEFFSVLHRGGSVATSIADIVLKVCTHDKSYLQKIEQEQEQIMKEHGRDFDWTILSKMTYLDKVQQETLRLEFTLTIWRYASRDVIFSDGLAIPKGSHVLMTMVGYNLDEEYYPDPDKWNPDRFEDASGDSGNVVERKKDRYPFLWGAGKRPCAGRVHAQTAMKMLPALMFRDYHVQFNSEEYTIHFTPKFAVEQP